MALRQLSVAPLEATEADHRTCAGVNGATDGRVAVQRRLDGVDVKSG